MKLIVKKPRRDGKVPCVFSWQVGVAKIKVLTPRMVEYWERVAEEVILEVGKEI